MDLPTVWVTLKLAVATTGILVALGLPLAYWLATTAWRGRVLVEALVTLPILLPPTVVGFYVMRGLRGTSLPFTFSGVLMGSVLFNAPFAIRPFVVAFGGIDRELRDLTTSLGATWWQSFTLVACPLARSGIATGAILALSHTVGEFGVVLMLGGNRPGVTRTLALSIYDDLQALDYHSANVTALSLLGFSFAVLAALYGLQRRFWI
jgi:molybdate transport system permease protein